MTANFTCTAHWSNAVLIENETLLLGFSAHVDVEHVRSGEVKESTVILVKWKQPGHNGEYKNKYKSSTITAADGRD